MTSVLCHQPRFTIEKRENRFKSYSYIQLLLSLDAWNSKDHKLHKKRQKNYPEESLPCCLNGKWKVRVPQRCPAGEPKASVKTGTFHTRCAPPEQQTPGDVLLLKSPSASRLWHHTMDSKHTASETVQTSSLKKSCLQGLMTVLGKEAQLSAALGTQNQGCASGAADF